MQTWKKESEAVYYAEGDVVRMDAHDIDFLKKNLMRTQHKRIRICGHSTPEASLHEMLIVIAKASYIRPHKHLNKVESFHVIEGEFDVIIFDDEGSVREIIQMGAVSTGKCFFYRLTAPYFHTIYFRSEFVVLHEVTNGPFKSGQIVYAPWSPSVGDSPEGQQFLLKLEHIVNVKKI